MKKTFKLLSVLIIGIVLFSSCVGKKDHIEKLSFYFPKAEIIDIDLEKGGGWEIIVNDTINKRLLFIKCFAGGERIEKEFKLTNYNK